MSKGNETTTKFNVDISDLKKAMQDAKRSIAVANSEFKAAASACDDWTKSSNGLSAKVKQLDSNLKSQEKILSSLETQYKAVVEEQGEGSKAADDLKIKINNQKSAIQTTERELSKYQKSLNDITAAAENATDGAADLSELLEDMKDAAGNAGEGFTTLKGAVATFAGNAISSLVGAIKDGVSSLMNLADETREYRTELAKMKTAALEAGASTDYIKDKWHDMGAVLGDEGAVAEGLNNLLAAGYTTQEEMDAITSHLEGAAIKWKDTLKFEGLADGLQETLATGAAVGSFGEMLERSGINLETFNEGLADCATEADKQNYVLSQLSGLGLSELSSAYRAQNEDLIAANKANSDYTDTLAAMGEIMEPVTTTAKEGFNGLLQEILKLVEDVDIEAFTSKMEEGFAVLKDDVLPAVKEGFGWILDNKDLLISGLAGIASGFVAFNVASVIMAVVNAFKAFKAANEGATVAQWLLNAAMNANPIMLIVTLVATLVGALITFVATNEDARAKIGEVWDNVKEKIAGFVESIKIFFTETIPEAFNSVIEWIKANWQSLLLMLINPFAGLFKYFYDNNKKFKEFVDTAIKFIKELPVKVQTWLTNTITKVTTWRNNMVAKAKETALNFINKVVEFIKNLPSRVQTWLTNTLSKVTAWASNLANKGKEAGKKLLDAIIEKVKEIPEKIKSIGSDIVKGLWNGINDMAGWIKDKISGFGEGVLDSLKNFFGINSPSKLMAEEVGKWLPEGIAVGITDNAKSALKAMKDLAVDTVGGARAGLSTATATTMGGTAVTGGVVNNFYQTINAPKQLSRLDIYRQSKNLLGYAGGGF